MVILYSQLIDHPLLLMRANKGTLVYSMVHSQLCICILHIKLYFTGVYLKDRGRKFQQKIISVLRLKKYCVVQGHVFVMLLVIQTLLENSCENLADTCHASLAFAWQNEPAEL